MAIYNPFARHHEVTPGNLLTYRILTFASWLLNVIPAIYYTYHIPEHNGEPHYHRHTTFGQSDAHPTPFTIDHTFVSIYWIAMWIGQVAYMSHLFSKHEAKVRAACTVGPHFILFNLLNFTHIMLWTRSHFILSEIALVLNFLQLASLYFRHSIPAQTHITSGYTSVSTIKAIHIPAVSMPLVWTFFAIFWNGAVMVRCHNAIVCRVLANVAIWGILPFAGTFLIAYGDWTVGLETAFLTAGLGVGQFFMKAFALQWIFAFTIMGIVFLASLATMYPGSLGAERVSIGERAPLLREEA